ncbi:fimbrial protein [Proteus mirabilis]|uniref:fimbrial protein n=2 Tax=Proteus mirabilis TaxID=584 RepID=UPI0018C4AC35|nr:fimbrial protein [Proteus mirabilis]MBG6016301.1 fimbrial protein [Proteus mirabilis]MBU9980028.1 fimbrial protein [Proteus mirabilis]MDX4951104.1 fimbrial protein [Proteus mirabilis]
MVIYKKTMSFLLCLSFGLFSNPVLSFTCKVASTGQIVGDGAANIYVNLKPRVEVNQNLIVDLSQQIYCKNDSGGGPGDPIDVDHINLVRGTTFGGALNNFDGSLLWYNNYYPIPLYSDTKVIDIRDRNFIPLNFRLYLRSIGAAGGKQINSGDLIAKIEMYKIADWGGGHPRFFTWNIYALNDVVMPTGGCDLSNRNVTINLPEYPGNAQPIPLSIFCPKQQNISYYLTGATSDPNNTVFTNVASNSPAKGVGIKISNNNGVIPANSSIKLGIVTGNSVSLGLSASYGETGERIRAGNVKSVIGVTFVYE